MNKYKAIYKKGLSKESVEFEKKIQTLAQEMARSTGISVTSAVHLLMDAIEKDEWKYDLQTM